MSRRKQLVQLAPKGPALPSAADFIESMLINPETGRPFELTDAERLFLKHAFELKPDGRALYPELVFGAPKKSGKTALAAMVLLYTVRVLGSRFGEGYVLSNSREQAANRVFQPAARIVQASPAFDGDAKATQEKITFASTGATLQAISAEYSTAAGANPVLSCFDELWAYSTELDTRLWDEMVPPPTKPKSWRLTTSYAGFVGESKVLEALYNRGLKGEEIAPDLYAQPGMLMYWTHDFSAPWQDDAWREQMREQLRPNAYLRLIENRWVTTESTFVDMEWWDDCVDSAVSPVLEDRSVAAWVGVDASVKHDSTAVVACGYDKDTKKVRLLWHRIFQPSPDDPLDFEATIEQTVKRLAYRFRLREVRYDPWQMQAVAQRLVGAGLPMVEFNQTVGNLTEASQNLYELIKARNLVVYRDDEMRLSVQRAVAKETPRGWRIAKEKTSHKIDVVVALAQAALGAIEGSSTPTPIVFTRDQAERLSQGSANQRFAGMRQGPAGLPAWYTKLVS
jgi:phage terminase large subunit-like protein